MRSVRALSRPLAGACVALAVILPGAVLAALAGDGGAGGIRGALAMAMLLTPVLLLSWGLFGLRATFAEFAAGRFFSREAVSGLRRLGRGGTASALAGVAAGPAAQLVLGLGRVELGFSSAQAIQLLLCGLVWLVGSVMERALALEEANAVLSDDNYRLREENAGFV